MITYADLQVWLDTQPGAGQCVIVPYVESVSDLRAQYQIEVSSSGNSGSSHISQGGVVNLAARQPTALSRFSLGLHNGDNCSIDLVLRDGEQEIGRYRFACPR